MAGTILVVDDAMFVRGMLRDILVPAGYHVHEAVNGRDAVSKFAELRPDLVTMDISMPVMDGFEAIREIVRRDPAARTLVITAQADAAAQHAAREAGAVGFLAKPFQPTRLLESVSLALAEPEL